MTMERRKRTTTEMIHDCDSLPLSEKVDCGFGVLAGKIDENSQKIDLVGKKVDQLDGKVNDLEKKIDDMDFRITGHLDAMDDRMERCHDDILDALGKKKVKGKWK